MLNFWVSLVVFLGSHMLVSRTKIKPWLVSRIGMRKYLISYSVLSVALLWWLIEAARTAPRMQLWPWDHTLYWFPSVMMPFAFILLISGFIVSNPLSIAPKEQGFNPEKPGLIVAITRHPLLWGFFLWSSSHLIVNGEFPLALMFFIFLVFSLAGIPLIDRKRKRELGNTKWQSMAGNTHAIIFCSRALRTGQFHLTKQDIIGIITGLCLYAAFYALHLSFFGIDPRPPL